MATAFITGAASMIGEGIAQTLAERGWDLMLTDINEAGLHEVKARLSEGTRAEIATLDVTDRTGISRVIGDATVRMSGIDALVHCAGGLRGLGITPTPLHEVPPQDWHRIIDINLKGTMNVTRGVLPVMKEQGSGVIVSITAGRGLRGGIGASHYSAAKAGIIVFTQTMVPECAEYGVRINSVAPGNTEARWKKPGDGKSKAPLGRPTSSEDVGKAVAWLVSDDASHVTGICIDVSGGTTLH